MSCPDKPTLFEEYQQAVLEVDGTVIHCGSYHQLFCELIEKKISEAKLEIIEGLQGAIVK